MPKLLDLQTYREIVREGRAAEALLAYVKRKPGRRPIGERAQTGAERKRAWRERQKRAEALRSRAK